MKISLLQLVAILSTIRYGVIGYPRDAKDLELDLEFIVADPGNGIIVDTLLVKATAPITPDTDKEISMQIELYEPREGQQPRVSRTESYKHRG